MAVVSSTLGNEAGVVESAEIALLHAPVLGEAMTMLGTHRAEVWPVSKEDAGGLPILEKVILASDHADGRSFVHLLPDQALYVLHRLAQIIAAYIPQQRGSGDAASGVSANPSRGQRGREPDVCGASVWPITIEREGQPPTLAAVVVESDQPAGPGPLYLSPDRAQYIYERLSQITLAFLPESVWGGEDAPWQQ